MELDWALLQATAGAFLNEAQIEEVEHFAEQIHATTVITTTTQKKKNKTLAHKPLPSSEDIHQGGQIQEGVDL